MLRLGILIGFLAPSLIATAVANSVQVTWAANPEPDVETYQVLYGTLPGSYGNVVETGLETTTAISDLAAGTTYYFALKAVNTAGLVSDPSDEVAYTVPGEAPPEPTLMPREDWMVVDVSSEESAEMAGELAFDGDPGTVWHTAWTPSSVPLPHWIEVDIGTPTEIRGFRYLPRPAGFTVGNIGDFEFLTSVDGVTWTLAASGSFPDEEGDKDVYFTTRVMRYFRLRALSEVSGLPYTSISEFDLILGEGVAPPPPNEAPVAVDSSVATVEDQAVTCALSASDADSDPLTYSIVSGPAQGNLSGTAPNLTYTPDANANGPDAFTFRANDGRANSNVATVSIAITPVNDPPVASGQAVQTEVATPVAVTLAASDVEGAALTYTIVSGPTEGLLTGTAPDLTYTPAAAGSGADSFTFRANDGSADSNVATVSITIGALPNTAPVALPGAVTTAEDEAVAIALSASDGESDPLTYAVVSGPAKGALTGSPPNLTYTPHANATGADSFTFRANDGTANSNAATVAITITPVNDAPVAAAQSVTTAEDTAKSMTLSASDVEGSALTFSILSGPSKGSLTGSGANRTYTPNANATGADSFTFRANDGTANSNVATVGITITPVNDAPAAVAKSVTTTADTPVSIQLTATDVEGSELTYQIVSQPAHGTLSGSPPNVSYTPDSGFTGADSFTFKASDGSLASSPATVSITVSEPGSEQDAFVLDRAGWSVVSVDSQETPSWSAAKAIDGDAATFWHTRFTSGATAPPHEIVIDLGAERIIHGFRYLPRQDALTVGNISNYEFHSSKNGNSWSAAAVGTFAAGASEKEILFTARAARYVRLRALGEVNGNLHSNAAELNVLGITGANHAPVAAAVVAASLSGDPVAIALAGTDPDKQPLDYKVVRKPRNGTLSGSGAERVYKPDPGFNGADSFTYTATDGLATSAAAEVTLTISGNPLPPKFRHTPIVGRRGTSGARYSGASLRSEIASTGSGSKVTFRKVAGPAWLEVTASGQLTGKAPANASGKQTFKVRATNNAGASADSALVIELAGEEADELASGFDAEATGGADGVARQTKAKTTVSGTGNLDGRKDKGYFVSKELKGNGSITVRLDKVRGAGSLARAGVMIRNSDAAAASHVFLGTNANGSLRIARRSKTGGATAEKKSGAKPHKKLWLRLVRKGDEITASTSTDGKRWKRVARHQIKLGKKGRIGLWVSGGGKGEGKATFKKLKIQS